MKILASIGKAKIIQRSLASGHIFLLTEGKQFNLPKFYDEKGNSYIEYYCNFLKEDVQVYPLHKGNWESYPDYAD